MRLGKEEAKTLKSSIKTYLPNSDIYLFGSRVDTTKKGGDIDILVLSDRKLTRDEIASIEFDFFRKFGEQKIDIVSYEYGSNSPFKEIALDEAVAL